MDGSTVLYTKKATPKQMKVAFNRSVIKLIRTIQESLYGCQERQIQALQSRNSQLFADGAVLGLQRPVAAP